MTPALALILLWLVASALSLVGIAVHLLRHGTRGVVMALLCPLGAVALFGFVSATIGLAEGAWGARSLGLWIVLAIGACGVVLTVVGWRAVLRPPLRAGQCAACGYELVGAAVCPECGRPRQKDVASN